MSGACRADAGGRRGFTMIEALVAVGLSLALAGSLFSFLLSVIQTRRAVAAEVSRERAGALLMDRVEAELLCCVVGDERTGAGVEGTATSLRILHRGVSVESEDMEGEGGTAEDLQISEYRFLADTNEVKGHRARWRATGQVVRMESLGTVIAKMRLRYFDGRRWRGSFDSLKADGLPSAVEISLWLAGVGDAEGEGAERPADRIRVVAIPGGGRTQPARSGLAEARGEE